ncbi:hypothetical protein ACFT7S_17185 [Streptomyces sp. NPDC057136]|uniref:hypothetical protein n=1 Tax=Streptomyces sp. NPDC057136 TaxID=3346029 RepID=UPI00364143D1
MTIKIKAAVLMSSAALMSAVLVPANAMASASSVDSPAVSTVHEAKAAVSTTTSTGGYIRVSPYGSSSSVSWAYDGERLTVYGSTRNSYGNKWYDVVDSAGYSGWIYCGNVTASC